MRTTIRLLKRYDGHPAGEIRRCKTAEDAQTLVSADIAEFYYENESDHNERVDAVVAEVERKLKAERRGGGLFHIDNYADEGWGRIDPKKFWSQSGGGGGSRFSNCAEMCKAMVGASKGNFDSRLIKDLAESSNESGGYAIPDSMANFIWQEMLEDSPFFTQATLLPMESNNITVPYIEDLDRSGGSGIHGITVPHVAEAGTLADISPTMGACELKLHKIGGRCRVSNEMLEDSALAMSTLLPKLFSDALSFRMQYEFLQGSGAGECLGIINAPATVEVTKEDGQTADTIVYKNICKMWSRLLPSARKNAVWMANLDTEVQLRTMSLVVGTGGSAVFVLNSAGAVDTIFGRKVYFTELLPTLGDAGDIIVFNPRAYGLGKKPDSQIRIEISEHARYENDQTVFRALARLDGQPLQSAPITPQSGSANTLSNFVKLGERGE
jgi:HK97 family phage major capsid protein